MSKSFGAVLTAVITPFSANDGAVDYTAVDKLIKHLCPYHTDGIIVCGTTGESPTVTDEEKLKLFKHYKCNVPSGISIIANTGTYCTTHSVSLTRDAKSIGVDAVMAVMPYYNKPNFDGQIAHFTAIADVGLPVMLYNVPGRTGAKILPDAVAELSSHPNIVAIKEAGGDASMVDWYLKNCNEGFAIYSGDDPLTYEMVKRGAIGVVSVASHFVGSEIRKMISLTNANELEKAESLHARLSPLFEGIFVTTSPIPVKTGCAMLGLCDEAFRLPMTPMRAEMKNDLKKLLARFVELTAN
jgi:4-hydroxy-tetrahydrodipicolinate synthase